jgi:hypothetical protein
MYWPQDDKATVMKKGDKLVLRYRVLVHSGNHQMANVASLFEKYKGE